MKGIDLFCTSQAATSICLSMEELVSSSSSSVIQLGGDNISCGRLIDCYNPIIRDSRRIISGSGRNRPLPPYSFDSKRSISGSGRNGPLPPCSSDSRKSISGSGRNGPLPPYSSDSRSVIGGSDFSEPLPPDSSQPTIFSKPKNNTKSTSSKLSKETKKKKSTGSWRFTKPGEFITPPSSTRYLLNEKDLLDVLPNGYNNDQVLSLVPNYSSSPLVGSKSCKNVKVAADESCNPPKPRSSTSSEDQVVVVLRVSLHCKACEKKIRKHLSRMEGVTSFNIDFAAKKVTVIGDVTPLGVLASISKVKNAQLWPPTVTSSIPSVKPNNLNEISDEKLVENISQNSLDRCKNRDLSSIAIVQLL